MNKLKDFIDQVRGTVNAGRLTAEEGAELIQAALRIIRALEESTAKPTAPVAFKLEQNVPNPFNPQTTIQLSLPAASAYTLSIYDITSRLVRKYTGNAGAGTVAITWDGTDEAGNRVGSGLYFYKVKAGSFTETKRMVLLK